MRKLAKNKWIRGLAFSSALLGSAYFSGCGKDNGITNPDPDPEPVAEYVLDSNVHQLNNLDIVSYDAESGEVIFSDNPNMNVGDVFIAGISETTPEGLLRKIQSVEGNSAITSRATLNDAIEECNFHLQNISLTPADKSLAGKSGFSFNFGDLSRVVYDADNNPNTTNDQIVVGGNLSFDFDITDLDLVANTSGLQEFVFNTYTTQNSGLEVVSKFPAHLSGSFPVHPPIPCAPIPLGPFTIFPYVHLNVTVDGDFSISETNISQNATLDAGVSYQYGDWDSYGHLDNDFDVLSPSFSTNMESKVSFGPKVTFLLANMAGISTGIDAYSRVEVDTELDPWWKLFAGIETTVGVDLTVMGWPIAGKTFPLASLEELLAQSEPLPEELIARLNVTPDNGDAPLEVLLDASGSSPLELIEEYTFDFGDGNSYNETLDNAPDGNFDGKTTHTYPVGSFFPQVIVRDNLARTDSESSFLLAQEGQVMQPGRIAYQVYENGNTNNVWVMNSDGSNAYRLASGREPFVSHNGEGVLLTNNDDIMLVLFSGGSRNLTNNSSASSFGASWSFDSEKVSFISRDNYNHVKLYVQNLDGSGREQLLDSIDNKIHSSWSPDGGKLLFNEKVGNEWEIYSINVDGSNKTNLTEEFHSHAYYPSWSPDGSRIIYSTRSGATGDVNGDIYTMNPDGTNYTFLVDGVCPVWSPDGSKVAYLSGPLVNVWTIQKDGTNPQNITNDSNLVIRSNLTWGQ